jgi:drug/metabolite transporter (DMT)-like permease
MSFPPDNRTTTTTSARLLVVLLAFCWGGNWVGTALALHEVLPWTMRFIGVVLGAATLVAGALLTGHDLRVPRGQRRHVLVAGLLNVVAFNILSAFAVLTGATSRVVIVVYSMPIWATLLSALVLGERLTPRRILAFVLCVVGLAVLVGPLLAHGVPPSVLLSLGCAWCWGLATLYIKWVKTDVPPLANAAWQLILGSVVIGIGMLIFEGVPHLSSISTVALVSLLYVGIPGVGLAHFLWWAIVAKLPATTAAIGSLLVPVVGVIGSIVILGERPTAPDLFGFVMIFAAAACVLLQPHARRGQARL